MDITGVQSGSQSSLLKQHKSKRIINIEGLIGAGKSTLIEEIKQRVQNDNDQRSKDRHLPLNDKEEASQFIGLDDIKVGFIPEPLDIWSQYKNNKDENILQLLYKDAKANSLKFQLIILKSLVDQFKQLDMSCDIVIVERSIESQRDIFVQQFINTGILDCLDLKIYEQFRDDLWLPVKQQLIDRGFVFEFVYIQTSLETCINRINIRNRPGEESIPIEYLQQLEQLHIDLFNKTPHIVINNDSLQDTLVKQIDKIINYSI